MKKSKGQTIDLLYTKKETKKKPKSKVNNRDKKKVASKKKGKARKTQASNETINLDNEIIIGLTPKKEPVKKPVKKKKANTKTKNSKNTSKNKKPSKTANKKARTTKTKKNESKEKNKKKMKVFKWIVIAGLAITAVVLFMLSSIFNIKKISVINNNRVKEEEIVNLSTLKTGVNMFKTSNRKIKNGIKQNAYVEDVKVKRSINGTVTLDIEERKPTYMLKFANAYIYINNQGYMLESSEKKLRIPFIKGFSTPNEEIKVGNRLNIEDLKKLDDVIKIMDSAKSISIEDKITEIDITDSTNYKLKLSSEGKTVQFGDCTNVNIKLLKIQALLKQEKGNKGEIYFQDSEKTVFREKV